MPIACRLSGIMETILLVDDEPHVRSVVREILELSDYTVLEAGDAEEACQIESAHREPIDLLLTDIIMPGLTGPELARQLGPRRPKMKILYMSAFRVVDLANQRIELDPGVPLVAKPFSVDALINKVRALLAPSPFARPPRPVPARS
jgi:two-component system cell cycle sensor histidine kinase/response regulator CckA